MTGTPIIRLEDIRKSYFMGRQALPVLKGVSLDIFKNEYVALMGPSGSGKSTALHLAAGLDEPSAGDVRSFGRSLARLGEAELASYRARDVALVFQSGNLWPGLTARENVEVGLRLTGRASARASVDRALDGFDLGRRESQRAGSLSGGEQQRVAIAAAAAREAPLVLADEPTAELDARNEQTVLRALRRLRDEFGSTVVVVTHSPRVAEAVDRVIEIRDGLTV